MFLKFKKLFIILKIPKPPYTCSQSHPLLLSRNQPLNLRDSSPRHPQLSNGWKKKSPRLPNSQIFGVFFQVS